MALALLFATSASEPPTNWMNLEAFICRKMRFRLSRSARTSEHKFFFCFLSALGGGKRISAEIISVRVHAPAATATCCTSIHMWMDQPDSPPGPCSPSLPGHLHPSANVFSICSFYVKLLILNVL